MKHENLVECLNKIGVDGKDVRIITNLYWHQKAAIRVDIDISDYTPIQRGAVRDVFFPLSCYAELILRQFEHLEGASIGGRNLSNLR